MPDQRTILSIQDALKPFECPICTLIEEKNQKHIEILLYESVNDRTLRKKFHKEEGFCSTHAKKVLASGAPLNHAILYDALMEEKLNRLNKDKVLNEDKPCLFCEKEKDSESYLLKAFIDGISMKSFFDAYKENGVLCTMHMDKANKMLKKNKALKEKLRLVANQKYTYLSNVLKSIKEKHDYRNTHKKWNDEEKILWQNVVALLVKHDDYRQ